MTNASNATRQSIDAHSEEEDPARTAEDSEPPRSDDRGQIIPELPIDELEDEQEAENLGMEKREGDLNP
jgi:hypothetical protein